MEQDSVDVLLNELTELAIKISKKNIIIRDRIKRKDLINQKELPQIMPNYNKTLLAHNIEKKKYDNYINELEHISKCLIKEQSEIEELLKQQSLIRSQIKVCIYLKNTPTHLNLIF
jgi:hypothetical protein